MCYLRFTEYEAHVISFILLNICTVVSGNSEPIDPPQSIRPYSGFGPIVGQTPCCHDRMTTVSCNRLQLLNPALFLYNCVHTPDFALVQCCRSCFDKRSPFTLNLDYDKIVDVLLTNPTTSDCTDRRGPAWCERLVKRKSFWEQRRFKGLDCSSMPFAFRVCRQSCGYCSSHEKKATVVYDYKVSTDIARCNNPAYGLAVPPAEHKTIDLPFTFRRILNRTLTTPPPTTTTTTPNPDEDIVYPPEGPDFSSGESGEAPPTPPSFPIKLINEIEEQPDSAEIAAPLKPANPDILKITEDTPNFVDQSSSYHNFEEWLLQRLRGTPKPNVQKDFDDVPAYYGPDEDSSDLL